jgi:hypothetical protein
MLRLFRARACCALTAVVLAVATTTVALEELLHAGSAHDVGCLAAADVGHDPSSHRFQAPTDERDSDTHCVACHLARAPRVGATVASAVGRADEGRAPRPIPAIGSARAAALASLPPRSPPRLS